jgi:hypothetical protein
MILCIFKLIINYFCIVVLRTKNIILIVVAIFYCSSLLSNFENRPEFFDNKISSKDVLKDKVSTFNLLTHTINLDSKVQFENEFESSNSCKSLFFNVESKFFFDSSSFSNYLNFSLSLICFSSTLIIFPYHYFW